jgi:translation initiation factor 2B subunit (eIF-2B alpha/beta/delta family)
MEEIIKDRRSGSSMILKKTLSLLEEVKLEKRLEVCRKIAEAHPAMAGLERLLKAVEKGVEVSRLKEIFTEMDKKTSERLRGIVKNKLVVTISRSHIVEKGLVSARHVAILKSEPAREGIDVAQYLRGRAVDVSVFPDSAIGYAIKLCDIVVVGADALYSNGFVNKTGTLPLALTAKHFSKQFYVAAPSYKFLKKKFEEPRNVDMLFEFVPANLVTAFIWEEGSGSLKEILVNSTLNF